MDDQLTLERARNGDRKAFETLMTSLEEMVWKVCYRILGNAEDARDAAQEAMIRAWRSMPSFRGNASLKTWMYQIAASAATDFYRRRQVRAAESLDALHEHAYDPPDAAPPPEEQVIRRDRDHSIRKALSELSDTLRIPLLLFAVEGLRYETIAEQLSLPVGTVKSRISRARQQMLESMNEYEHPMEQKTGSSVQSIERRTRQ